MRLQVGSEIIWDDIDSSDRKMSATAFMSSMSYLKVRVGRLQMHGKGLLAKLACKRHALTGGWCQGKVGWGGAGLHGLHVSGVLLEQGMAKR